MLCWETYLNGGTLQETMNTIFTGVLYYTKVTKLDVVLGNIYCIFIYWRGREYLQSNDLVGTFDIDRVNV